MNESLKKAISELLSISSSFFGYCDCEHRQWAMDNGLKCDTYNDQTDLSYFFRAATRQGLNEDKYVYDHSYFLIRQCPKVNESSFYLDLLRKYDINKIIVTPSAHLSLVIVLISLGYKATPITLHLTDAWKGQEKDNSLCVCLVKE